MLLFIAAHDHISAIIILIFAVRKYEQYQINKPHFYYARWIMDESNAEMKYQS